MKESVEINANYPGDFIDQVIEAVKLGYTKRFRSDIGHYQITLVKPDEPEPSHIQRVNEMNTNLREELEGRNRTIDGLLVEISKKDKRINELEEENERLKNKVEPIDETESTRVEWLGESYYLEVSPYAGLSVKKEREKFVLNIYKNGRIIYRPENIETKNA